MTEHSIIWPGSSIGDAVEAPLDPDEIANAFYYFFEFCPRAGIGYRGKYDNVDSATYEDLQPTISILGKTILQIGAVIAGYLNALVVTNSGFDITINSGGAVVDGRLYIADAAPLTQTVTVPGAGSRYWLFGIRCDYAGQSVNAWSTGPQTNVLNLVQPVTRGVDYVMPLAIVSTTFGSGSPTIYDCRRFIAPNGYQQARIMKRQGGSAFDWSIPCITNYDVGGDAIAIPACNRTPYAFNPTNASPLVFATPKGTNPLLAAGVVPNANSEGIIVDPFDGTVDSNTKYFSALIIGSDVPSRYNTKPFYVYTQYDEESV